MTIVKLKDLGHENLYKKYYNQHECKLCNPPSNKCPLFHLHQDGDDFYLYYYGERVVLEKFHGLNHILSSFEMIRCDLVDKGLE